MLLEVTTKQEQQLIQNKSRYVGSKKLNLAIRTSNHLPNPNNLKNGSVTGPCENVYLIFVKSLIDLDSPGGEEITELILLTESNNVEDRKVFADIISDIGKDAVKNIAYKIIDDIDLENLKKLELDIFKRVKNFGFKSGEDKNTYVRVHN